MENLRCKIISYFEKNYQTVKSEQKVLSLNYIFFTLVS